MSSPLYKLENVSFSYGETKALDKIDLAFEKGKFYTIIGPNGCGKTTLLDILSGYRLPHSGKISLYDKDLIRYSKQSLARQIALVPQEFSLDLGFTVEEVVLMGRHPHMPRFGAPEKEDWQFVNTALENIGLESLRYNNANLLSGGQKQRAIVARALAQNTETLLFDEATASLDIKYMLQIFNLAKELVVKEGRTVIAVLHDINLAAAYGDQIIVMKEGSIHSLGTPRVVMNSDTIRNVFGVEARVGEDLFGQPQQLALRYGKGV